MAEDLRRKHIKTLEVLQQLSDENAALKSENEQLKEVKWAELPEVPAAGSGKTGAQASTDLLASQEAELKEHRTHIEELLVKLKQSEKEAASFKDKYGGEKALVHQLKKQVDTQGSLMKELRAQMEAGRVRSEEEHGGLGDGEEKIAQLESQVSLLKSEVETTGEKLEVSKGENAKLQSALEAQAAQQSAEKEATEKKLDEVELLMAAERKKMDAEVRELKAELERQAALAANAAEEILKAGMRVEALEEETRVKGEEVLLWKNRYEEMNKKAEDDRAASAAAPPPEQPQVEAPARKEKDFDRFVKLKKENSLLKMQIGSLQQSMSKRMR
jgi:hypothetical protein